MQVYNININVIMQKLRTSSLHEDHKKEAQIHGQVKQVPNELQVEGIDGLFFPLSFHKHVTHIENIFYKG